LEGKRGWREGDSTAGDSGPAQQRKEQTPYSYAGVVPGGIFKKSLVV
jgi:hypothetical protein